MSNNKKLYDDAFLLVMKEEGVKIDKDGNVLDSGYVNDKDDPGGETKFGISAKFLGRSPRELTLSEANDIYEREFWDAYGADKVASISPQLAIMVFDTAVNQGPEYGIRLLQKALGVYVDGIIGPVTLRAITPEKLTSVLAVFALKRNERYAHLAIVNSKLVKFLPGWVIRVNNVYNYCSNYK